MDYRIFSDKEVLRQNKDLLELHKRCCKTYLIQRSLKHHRIKKFFIIYDFYINDSNIRRFFFRSIKIFIQAILLGQLDDIEDYICKNITNGKRKRKKSK